MNLQAIRIAVDTHNASCDKPPTAILLHPYDHGVLRWDDLWGIPVLADDSVPVKRVLIECGGKTWDSEQELPADTEGDNCGTSAPKRTFTCA